MLLSFTFWNTKIDIYFQCQDLFSSMQTFLGKGVLISTLISKHTVGYSASSFAARSILWTEGCLHASISLILDAPCCTSCCHCVRLWWIFSLSLEWSEQMASISSSCISRARIKNFQPFPRPPHNTVNSLFKSEKKT